MRLHYEFSTPVARTELDDYVRHLEVDARCYDADGLREYTVGRLALDQVLWADALTDGESLFEVCDADSQGLHEVHVTLTGGGQEFRRDLHIEEITDHVLFLYRAVFHPAVHSHRPGVLHAVFTLFGELSLAVMWKDTTGLPEAELADLGFRKVAGSDLIFRHSALRTPFGDRFPKGRDADAVAQPDHEAWVEREWNRGAGPAAPGGDPA
jgi:hypothetical protein